MSRRPFEDIRPLGPLVESPRLGDDEDDDVGVDISEDELDEIRRGVAEETGIKLSRVEGIALNKIDSPMLQSYLMNSMSDLVSRGHEKTFEQIVNADPAVQYARKVGALDDLEEAQEVLS